MSRDPIRNRQIRNPRNLWLLARETPAKPVPAQGAAKSGRPHGDGERGSAPLVLELQRLATWWGAALDDCRLLDPRCSG
eukprot:10159323-Alexandrium_andersonii.AAC.1